MKNINLPQKNLASETIIFTKSNQYYLSGDLWLVGGSDNGRLHIYHSGSWGTICNDHFGSADALVVCKQLKMR